MATVGRWSEISATAGEAYADGLDTRDVEAAGRSFREALARVRALLGRLDEEGVWWQRGRMAACEALSATEPRFRFCRAFPRSALFGETLVASAYRAVVGDTPPEEACRAAQFVNLFVTALDGMCDEAPDLLSQIVPAASDLFARFPEPPVVQPTGQHPVVWLAFEVGVSATRILHDRLRSHPQPGPMGRRLTNAVRTAYAAELESLKLQSRSALRSLAEDLGEDRPSDEARLVIEERTRLSAKAFNASLQMAALFADADEETATGLEELADQLGAFFGWVDDVVDLGSDHLQGQPNMAAAALRRASCDLGTTGVVGGDWRPTLREETWNRWQALEAALAEFPWHQRARQDLQRAALAWFGSAAPAAGCRSPRESCYGRPSEGPLA